MSELKQVNDLQNLQTDKVTDGLKPTFHTSHRRKDGAFRYSQARRTVRRFIRSLVSCHAPLQD